MLSKKCKYALKAMIYLADFYQKGQVSTSVIAEKEHIPKKFLEQILLELKRWKLINSKQGVQGGYYLLKPPSEISLADLYRIFDGPIALIPCVSINYYEKCDDCTNEETCHLRDEFIKIRDKTRLSMMNATLEAFLKNK